METTSADGDGRDVLKPGRGVLVISLDFELYWGLRDKQPLADCETRLLGAQKAIPRMLELFTHSGIHATWATVGMLFAEGREELLGMLPDTLPAYSNPKLSPYSLLQKLGDSETDDPCHFAPSLIAKIADTPGQEIGCHTFSHYYCREPGQSRDAFTADIAAAVAIAKRNGIALHSIVLPRNQIEDTYLDVLPAHGIIAYRGAAPAWMYAHASSPGDMWTARGMRLLDAYINLSGSPSYPASNITPKLPLNIPASMFLRPFSPRLAWADGLRLKRIKRAITHAACCGEVFHLWWHPHNMGLHLDESLRFLDAILRHYSTLRDTHGMQSMGMAELADAVLGAPSHSS